MPAHEAKKKDGRAATSAVNLAKARATRLLKPKDTKEELPEPKLKSKRQPIEVESESEEESETESEESSDDEVQAFVMRAAKKAPKPKKSKPEPLGPDPAVLAMKEELAQLREKFAKMEAPKSEPAVPQKSTNYSSIFP